MSDAAREVLQFHARAGAAAGRAGALGRAIHTFKDAWHWFRSRDKRRPTMLKDHKGFAGKTRWRSEAHRIALRNSLYDKLAPVFGRLTREERDFFLEPIEEGLQGANINVLGELSDMGVRLTLARPRGPRFPLEPRDSAGQIITDDKALQ